MVNNAVVASWFASGSVRLYEQIINLPVHTWASAVTVRVRKQPSSSSGTAQIGYFNVRHSVPCNVPEPTATPTPTMTPTSSTTMIHPEQMDIAVIALPLPSVAPELLQAGLDFFNGNETNDDIRAVRLPVIDPSTACLGEDNDIDKQRCAEYGYVAFYGLFTKYVGNPPTIWDLLSVVYVNELGNFQYFQNDMVSIEALMRNFFEYSAGGCRYDRVNNVGFDCSYHNIIQWLGTIHSWYARVSTPNNGFITVNLLNLIQPSRQVGYPTDFELFALVAQRGTIHNFHNFTGGIFAYDQAIQIATAQNLVTWRTGQGPDVPSNWGNQEINPPGSQNIANFYDYNPSEHFRVLFIHDLLNAGSHIEPYFPGSTPQPNLEGVRCTQVSVIISTNGAFNTERYCQSPS